MRVISSFNNKTEVFNISTIIYLIYMYIMLIFNDTVLTKPSRRQNLSSVSEFFLGAYVKREFLNLTKCMRRIRIRATTSFARGGLQKCGGDDGIAEISRRDRSMRRFFGKIMLCRRRGYLKTAVN